jgi:hypothetical protein
MLPFFLKAMGLFRRPTFVIKSPRLGILNLKGASAADHIATDRSALSTFFSSIDESEATVPSCDVLFLYCDLTADGAVAGSESSFREIIRDSGATVVVVASDNSAEHYMAAGKLAAYGMVNLAMTIDRKGEAFPSFYKRLFDYMSQGISMPVAWVKIAPQIPSAAHQSCPSAICSLERGQVEFGSPIGFTG